jgi:hypothetical protein
MSKTTTKKPFGKGKEKEMPMKKEKPMKKGKC